MKEVQSLFANIIDIWRECAKHEKPLLSACRVAVQYHTESAAGSKPHTGAAMRGNRLTEVQPCPGFTSVSQLPVCVVCSQSRLTRRRRLAVYMCRCLQVDLRGLRVTWKTTSDWIQMNRNQTLQVIRACGRCSTNKLQNRKVIQRREIHRKRAKLLHRKGEVGRILKPLWLLASLASSLSFWNKQFCGFLLGFSLTDQPVLMPSLTDVDTGINPPLNQLCTAVHNGVRELQLMAKLLSTQ